LEERLKRGIQDVKLQDWRKMRGMARGNDSLTEALLKERASEKAHDDSRV
jgi:hypothetical protein